MDDPLAVGLVQCVGDLDGELKDLLGPGHTSLQPLLQGFALDVLHDEKIDSVLMANVVEGADVRVRKTGECAGFAL